MGASFFGVQRWVEAKSQKTYIVFTGPGMENVALKMISAQPGKHRFLPIKWDKHEDGSDKLDITGLDSDDLTNEDVLFLSSMDGTNGSLLSQYNAMSQICDKSIGSLTIVVPCMPGTASGNAEQSARLLGTLPQCGAPHRVITFDTSLNAVIPGAKTEVKSTASMVQELIASNGYGAIAHLNNSTAASQVTDVERISVAMTINAVKSTPQILGGNAKGKHVLLVDDSCMHSKESVQAFATAIKNSGALSVSLYCTHTSPSLLGLSQLAGDHTLSKVYVTNSNCSQKTVPPSVKVLDMTPLILSSI